MWHIAFHIGYLMSVGLYYCISKAVSCINCWIIEAARRAFLVLGNFVLIITRDLKYTCSGKMQIHDNQTTMQLAIPVANNCVYLLQGCSLPIKQGKCLKNLTWEIEQGAGLLHICAPCASGLQLCLLSCTSILWQAVLLILIGLLIA